MYLLFMLFMKRAKTARATAFHYVPLAGRAFRYLIHQAPSMAAKVAPEEESLQPQTTIRKYKVPDTDHKTGKIPLALYKLCTQPVSVAIVKPKDYFVASNELVVFSLAICWSITAAYDYKQFWGAPAHAGARACTRAQQAG